ncbi:chromosome partitioning protein ParB [Dysgonomonas termitidis]|uniref:Chromosome partitioning protein ParB n=1 Tax=Dysgonomonas termitidis TaxID=1516126 RepID=A0ABV9KYF4_9BACT
MEKQGNLFNDNIPPVLQVKKKLSRHEDYEAFVEKFKPKKTTDDCYTPPAVYDCILKYVSTKVDLSGREIIRPFWPGGDYEKTDYPDNYIVIDNPPFSIISKIARYYLEKNIDFFLFAPHLTLFSANIDCTAIVCAADIVYENGAKVKTSFLSNLFGNARVIGDPALYSALTKINEKQKANLPKYQYPENVLTVSMVAKFVALGIPVQFDKKELYHTGGLDEQKKYNTSLFGSGFLLSDKAAADKAAADKANIIEWKLSDRERNIIKSLG